MSRFRVDSIKRESEFWGSEIDSPWYIWRWTPSQRTKRQLQKLNDLECFYMFFLSISICELNWFHILCLLLPPKWADEPLPLWNKHRYIIYTTKKQVPPEKEILCFVFSLGFLKACVWYTSNLVWLVYTYMHMPFLAWGWKLCCVLLAQNRLVVR